MDSCDTALLPSRSRAAALAKFYETWLEPVVVLPDDATRFAATLTSGQLGETRVARLASGAGTIHRGAEQIRSAQDRSYSFLLQVSGTSRLSQYGHMAGLAAGDLTLCDSGAPYVLSMGASCEILILRVPAALLKEHLPTPECFCGRLLSAREGLTSTAAAMALSLFDQLEGELAPHYQSRVARHLLDMIATAYAIAFESLATGSSIVSGRHATVKRYIEQHLRDPDLSPSSIAARLKLSSRYLRMIFATNNETVSAYILRRRLEECARQIGDPAWRGHSMTEIAFAWGFNSAPHFTRSFRDRFDMSPRDHRRLKLDEQDSAFRRPSPPSPAMAAAQAA